MRGHRRRIGWVGTPERERVLMAGRIAGAVGFHVRVLLHRRNCFRAGIVALRAAGRVIIWRTGCAGFCSSASAHSQVCGPAVGAAGGISG